jgi:hypothetical protein
VLPARDVKNIGEHLVSAAGAVLERLSIPRAAIAAELGEMAESTYARTASKSVLGSMNEYAFALEWELNHRPATDFIGLALRLAETPLSPLRYESARRATEDLFA